MRSIIKHISCVFCKKVFPITTHNPNRKYCNKACVTANQRTGRMVNCSECGKSIYRQKGKIGNVFFCNRECQCKGRYKFKEPNCLGCGVVLGRHKYKYCSIKCQMNLRHQKVENLIKLGKYQSSNSKILRIFLIKERSQQCEECLLTKWRNKSIPLTVHHKDGNYMNNDLKNLMLICPNCHALTPTFGIKNRGNGRYFRRVRYQQGKSS